MIKDFINKKLNKSYLFIFYIIFFFIIFYLDKIDNNKIIDITIFIVVVTIFWILVILFRNIYIKYFIYLNNIIQEKYIFILKIRWEIINIPFWIMFILSNFMYIDKILIYILFLNTRQINFFYFFRLVLYYNILIWLSLIFFLISDLYHGILILLEFNTKIKDYLKDRIHFFLFSLILALLFNIRFIDIIILLWIFDTIFTTYYIWIQNYFTADRTKDWSLKVIVLRQSFNIIKLNYVRLANSMRILIEFRKQTILFFKNLNYEFNDQINFFKKYTLFSNFYIYFFEKFWKDKFSKFLEMKTVMWFFYQQCKSDEDFILKYIHIYIIGSEMDNESFINKQLLIQNISDILEDEMNLIYFKEAYFAIYNVLNILKHYKDIREKFFSLRLKYQYLPYNTYGEYPDIKEFFIEFYEFSNKFQLKE